MLNAWIWHCCSLQFDLLQIVLMLRMCKCGKRVWVSSPLKAQYNTLRRIQLLLRWIVKRHLEPFLNCTSEILQAAAKEPCCFEKFGQHLHISLTIVKQNAWQGYHLKDVQSVYGAN